MFLENIFNRYVRHGLTVAAGFLISKGMDAEVVNQTADAVVNFSGAAIATGLSLLFSRISDKVKF